jgi:hypothetical protein
MVKSGLAHVLRNPLLYTFFHRAGFVPTPATVCVEPFSWLSKMWGKSRRLERGKRGGCLYSKDFSPDIAMKTLPDILRLLDEHKAELWERFGVRRLAPSAPMPAVRRRL